MATMTTSQWPAPDSGNLSVQPEIQDLLPDALIEHLWKLALDKEWRSRDTQSFVLKSRSFCGRDIQDIFHIGDNDHSMVRSRVFGAKTVDCTLRIHNSQGNYQMRLCTEK